MNKIFSSLLLIVSVVLIQLPIAADASAAGAEKSEKPEQLVKLYPVARKLLRLIGTKSTLPLFCQFGLLMI